MNRVPASTHVVGEWARFSLVEGGTLYSEDVLIDRRMSRPDAGDFDDAIAALPKAFWHLGRTMVADRSDTAPGVS